MILGNKCDLDVDRAVSQAKSNSWARDNDLPLLETSAKDDLRIQEAFIEASKIALKREVPPILGLNKIISNKITLSEKSAKGTKKNCCN